LRGIDPDDFPPLTPDVEGTEVMRVDPVLLRDAIGHVVFAAATDDSRPVLAGVQFDARDGSVALAAADGFRMSLRTMALTDPVVQPLTIIVPARAMQELSRVLAEISDPVDVRVTPNQSQLIVTAPGLRFVSRLIDGTFPDLRQVVPKSWSTRTVVPREDLLDATKRAAIFARSNNDIVRLEIAPASDTFDMGRLTITATAADTGENRDEVDARVEGGQMQVAFNGRYLTDVLSVMRGASVAFELQGPNTAGVIRSVDTDDFVHVIMPMVIGSN
jgi:DNA polymerase-3 subunit beta